MKMPNAEQPPGPCGPNDPEEAGLTDLTDEFNKAEFEAYLKRKREQQPQEDVPCDKS
jgi:hypothetical protein